MKFKLNNGNISLCRYKDYLFWTYLLELFSCDECPSVILSGEHITKPCNYYLFLNRNFKGAHQSTLNSISFVKINESYYHFG